MIKSLQKEEKSEEGRKKLKQGIKKKSKEQSEEVSEKKPKISASNNILDFIVSPLKKDYYFELWTIKEIAIFECSICIFGKRFNIIASMIPTKSFREVIQFYDIWKHTSHYTLWKQ